MSRFDPDDLGSEDGTEFPGAAELWEREQAKTRPELPSAENSGVKKV